MRVLLTHRPGGAYAYISDGWLNALLSAGHIAMRWDGNLTSWSNFCPDLYIGCSGHRQPIPRDRGNIKVAIHVNPYSGINTGVNESTDAINWVVAQKPDVVFGYGSEYHRYLWEYWTSKYGLLWVPMPTAGDCTVFNDFGLERDVDVVYVGGYWPYKARNIDKFLLPLLRSGVKYSVFGWGNWPIPVSKIDDVHVVGMLNRAKIGPCIVEPHTAQYGFDLPERLWKVALSGALVVHDQVHGLEQLMPSAIVARTPEEYVDVCRELLSNDIGRQQIARQQRCETLNRNTYFHRMATLFSALHEASDYSSSFNDESAKFLKSPLLNG